MGKVNSVLKIISISAFLSLILSAALTLEVKAQITYKMPDWSIPYEVLDLAVSADGSIVATAVYDGSNYELRVYDADGNLLWKWGQPSILVTAVDLSDDGNAVVAAISNSTSDVNCLLFWKNARSLRGENPSYDWSSQDLGWPISNEALAISSSGNEVVAVGTEYNVFYWNNTLTLSGSMLPATWWYTIDVSFEYVDISSDGDTIAILGKDDSYVEGYVFKNCKSRTGHTYSNDLWHSFGDEGLGYGGISLSDDGLYVAAGVNGTIYLFNTTPSGGGWAPQWTCHLKEYEWAAAVDISGDGNTVVAVTNSLMASPYSLMIFHDAKSKHGVNISADAQFIGAESYTPHNYTDVSIDYAGRIAVAGTGDYVFAVETATGEPLWLYNGEWPKVSWLVEVSKDGSAIVVAGSETASLYYFSTEEVALPVGGVIVPETRLSITNVLPSITIMVIALATFITITIILETTLKKGEQNHQYHKSKKQT